jgi:hypothetical protein
VTRFAQCLLVLTLAAGCAIAPTARIIRAQIEIDAATGAGADQYALYEITKAREYEHKAREEIGYSHYEIASKYAEAAVQNGEHAKQLAREHPLEQATPQPTAPPPAQSPVIVPAGQN